MIFSPIIPFYLEKRAWEFDNPQTIGNKWQNKLSKQLVYTIKTKPGASYVIVNDLLIFVPKLSALPIHYHYQTESERKFSKLSSEMNS